PQVQASMTAATVTIADGPTHPYRPGSISLVARGILLGRCRAVHGCLWTLADGDSNERSEVREAIQARDAESRTNSSISSQKLLTQPNIRDIIGRWGVVLSRSICCWSFATESL